MTTKCFITIPIYIEIPQCRCCAALRCAFGGGPPEPALRQELLVGNLQCPLGHDIQESRICQGQREFVSISYAVHDNWSMGGSLARILIAELFRYATRTHRLARARASKTHMPGQSQRFQNTNAWPEPEQQKLENTMKTYVVYSKALKTRWKPMMSVTKP